MIKAGLIFPEIVCGKKKYLTKSQAAKAIKRMGSRAGGNSAYFCNPCQAFHIGHHVFRKTHAQPKKEQLAMISTKPTVKTPANISRGYPDTHKEPRHFVPLKNTPGELVKINKMELHVDPKYQRPVNQRAVIRIANNWSWLACGVLTISFRKNASYFIVDGQHRWEAAKLLKEVKELPCLAFELDSVKDEAIGFLANNAERRVPDRLSQHNALLLADDPIAKVADELAREGGRRIGKPSDKTHLACLGTLVGCIRVDEQAIRKVWPIITQLARDRPLAGHLIHGIWGLERRMPKGFSLTDRKWHDRLVAIGEQELLRSMRTTTLLEGKVGENILAQGIARALNKGLKGNHINIDFSKRM